ncbi:MAG: DUF1330 domain-containing protein [Boseongicola sp.]|nr:DUF1330 domain-containing protein [Boseongicola sp.]NNJ68064.1 DUF1330 domain-containing protein [Boseongicola sp.]
MAKGYIMGHVTVRDAESYKEYVEKDTPILAALGGRFIIRGGQSETVEGESLMRHVLIEFDSYELAKKAYNDPDYQAVADIRRRNADSVIILVEGTD